MPEETEKHTPEPWEVEYTDTGIGVYPVCDAINATFKHENELMRIEAEANAHLIAASPEMLKALQYIVQWNPHDWNPEEARNLANAAIAKATGTVKA